MKNRVTSATLIDSNSDKYDDEKKPRIDKGSSRWFTPEFMLYHLIAVAGYSYVIYLSVTRSDEYATRTPKLSKGWFFGRRIDLSDYQWAMWRKNFPLLLVGLSVFALLNYFIKTRIRKGRGDYMPSITFYNVIAAVSVFYIHGFDIIWLFTVSLMNYIIAKTFKGSHMNPLLCWVLNIAVLCLADYTKGFKGTFTILGLPFLESYKGLFAWNTYFKISMLRHISFNLDYYWMIKQKPLPENLKNRSAYTQAEETHHPAADYGIAQFFAYVYYLPLFLAGPVVTFNAFLAQVKTPQTTYKFQRITIELIKVLLYTVGLEIWLHFFYQYSFNEFNLWKTQNFPSAEVCLVAYWTLNFMYTKFLIIWRFFRVMSLFDGIDTPENMNRCVNNNFTFTGFWRSWHGSLNKWIVRYLYVPLGGSRTQAVTIWIIYSFIGLWHDLLTRWLAWAWCNCVFFSIEIAVMKTFHSDRFAWLWSKKYWRHIIGVAGVFNIYLLMLANLAILHGFTNTPIFLTRAFLGEGGFTTFVGASVWLFCGVMYMQEIREGEKRKNQTKRF